jgi:hypothetical protein
VVSRAINSIQQNSISFSRYWYSFLKLLFNRYQKLGVILCRLLLLFSKPQNGAEILFDPFSAAGYACSSSSGFWRVVLGGLY